MAVCVEEESVIDVPVSTVSKIIKENTYKASGDVVQINPEREILWVYNSETDIHYFYSLK